MKILHVTPAFQHPDVRGPTRHYHFLRELSRRHHITLVTLAPGPIPQGALAEVNAYARQVVLFDVLNNSGGRIQRSWSRRTALRQMRTAIADLLRCERFDVVLFHGKSVFSAIDGQCPLPLVVDFCDATSMRVRSEMKYAPPARYAALWLRYLRVRQVEKRLLHSTPHLAFISCRDRQAILGTSRRDVVLPNGIDLLYWRRRTEQPEAFTIVFTGVMNYAPNHDAASHLIRDIAPQLIRAIPNIQISIVGRDPDPSLVEAARNQPGVVVTGFVQDMRPYLERAAVFVAPVRYASGMQNKVQEAMAMSVPVVCTSVVAAGIQIDAAQPPPLVVADTPQHLAEAIIRLLNDRAERHRLAIAGRQFAERHFLWSRSADKLEAMCQRAASLYRRNGTRVLNTSAVH